MLILARKKDQRLRIGEDIIITVTRLQGDRVQLGVEAPDDVRILREEVYQKELLRRKSLENPTDE